MKIKNVRPGDVLKCKCCGEMVLCVDVYKSPMIGGSVAVLYYQNLKCCQPMPSKEVRKDFEILSEGVCVLLECPIKESEGSLIVPPPPESEQTPDA